MRTLGAIPNPMFDNPGRRKDRGQSETERHEAGAGCLMMPIPADHSTARQPIPSTVARLEVAARLVGLVGRNPGDLGIEVEQGL